MKITVFADTHRNYNALNAVVNQNLDSDLFLHIGDGQFELLEVASAHPDKKFLMVKGNRDYGSLDDERIIDLDEFKIYCNHGHELDVNSGLEKLLDKAAYNDCKIAVYGHTHLFKTDLINGIYVMNPGSLESPRGKNPPTYGVIKISDGGEIIMNIIEYKSNV
ncbi:MAG: YfcE family phosphodiesterase [Eubacterium sp.]|jgi:putative phosphoesterase|nr:YfcE family phosphodiesterase [Eubacterium sp.]